MAKDSFAIRLSNRIKREYVAGGHTLGWRLLYSPANVLSGARVALIGVNPGGGFRPDDQAEFAMDTGSAYESEIWANRPAGDHRLQRQVLALFERIGEEPEKVLAGNLVPFRSPRWEYLENPERAVEFGKEIWNDILTKADPKFVIAMGNTAAAALKDILHVEVTDRVRVSWGNVCGSRGNFPGGGVFVGLPHLSRFGIMTRPKSEPALRELF